jgi:hypothetical protein
MRATLFTALVIFITLLAGCTRNAPANAQQATVTLSDGTTFSGAVTSSSPASITLQASTGESRTWPMTQVSSVQYAQPQPNQTAANQTTTPQPAAGSPPPPAGTDQTTPPPAAAPPPPAEVVRTIPSGATLQVRNNTTIDSETAEPGQRYAGVVSRDVKDTNGEIAIPRGSGAMLVVRSASGQGKFQGQSDIVVDVASVTVNGHTYRLETTNFSERGQQGVGKNKRTAEFAGGGAALGGIIGAIAGGGKGAAIGLLAGGAAGTGAQAASRGKAVRIPSETLLSFRLEAPVNIRQLQ